MLEGSAIGKVPGGKYMVVQTVSYFRVGAAAGSIGQLFIKATQAPGHTASFALPSAVADGSTFPASTLSATFYAYSGTSLIGNLYRSGDTSTDETCEIVISGYLVAGPPTS